MLVTTRGLNSHDKAASLDSRFIGIDAIREGNKTIIPPQPKYDYSGDKPIMRSPYIINHEE